MSENMGTGLNNFLTPVQVEPIDTPSVPTSPTVGAAPTGPRTDLFTNPSYRFAPDRGQTADQIRSNPQNMETIRNYMIRRQGVHMSDYSDEDLYDAFVNHMRSFNVNEVTTGGELLWVRRASDEDKQLANEAYTLFDSLGSVFTNDGISGAFDGVKDYVQAMALSPSTWIGGLVGRVATAPAKAATTAQIRQLARTAITNRTGAAVGDVATQAAVQSAEQSIRQIATQAARQSAIRETAIAVTTDAALSSGQDALRQLTLMEVGAQDGYSALETILGAATGLVGGMPSAISYVARQRDAGDLAARSAIVAQRTAEAALEKARPEIEKALEAFDGQMIDWLKTVRDGNRLIENSPTDSYSLANRAVRMLLDPDPANRASIVGAMQRAGVTIRRGDPEVGAVEQIASFARNISPEKKAGLDVIFKKHLNGMSFDEFTDVMVASVSQAGTNLKLAKDAADALSKVLAARTIGDKTIVGLTGEALRREIDRVKETPSPDITRYVQSIWRRALVSHPATTAVNVAGWAQVEAFKGVAEILHGGVLGTTGLVAKLLSPVSTKAGQWADKALLDSKALIRAQGFKLRTLLSPSSTREIFDAVIAESNPKRVKKLQDSLYGGIEGTSEAYNIPASNQIVKKTEKLLDMAGNVSLLKVQDVYTKSMSFVTELDKQLRLLGNSNLSDVLKTGDLSNIPDEVFEKAINATLKSTMSFDYGRGKGTFAALARAVESVSNAPIIGFIFPFGRFMNNQLAFVLEYTPLGILGQLGEMRKRGIFNSPDIQESMAKALVGSAAFATLIAYDRQNQEAGHAWYEVVDQTGSVINVQNMAPVSAYMAAARYWNSIKNRQLTPELQSELIAQLGALSMMNTVQQDPLGEIVKYVNSMKEDQEGMETFGDFLGGIAPFFTGVAAGFTRPLEPLDALVGFVGNTDAAVDRRQLSGVEAAYRGATRYVENVFLTVENVLSEPVQRRNMVGPARQDASQYGPVRDPNPLSRMLGRREQQPPTNVTRMFNMVNIPIWTIQERTGIPEWDALMNDIITPRLDQEAKQLMQSRAFTSADFAGKERLVRLLLRRVRDDTISMIESQMGVSPNLLRMRQAFIRKPQSLRRQAMEDLNINTSERELSYSELVQLNNYIAVIQRNEAGVIGR